MATRHKVAVIGLGVIGQRMLTDMPRHERLEVIGAWDLNPSACEAARRKFPWLTIAPSAEALIADAATDLVYIGVPPLAHGEYTLAAIAAGKAVFCEKPLGVDVAESRSLVDRVEASGLANAVNYVFGTAHGAEAIRAALDSGEAGDVAGIDILLHFAQWPRDWQASATWLARRQQGGFVREVLSHYVYLVENLLGPSEVVSATLCHPLEPEDAAETHITAQIDCGDIPVTIAGSVGGAGPEAVEFTLWGTKKSYRLTDWYRLWTSDGGPWTQAWPDASDDEIDSCMDQLDALADMLEGKPHRLPDFRAALSVQERIEEMLGSG